MSADNYVKIRKFDENDYRWGEWSASDDDPDFSNERFTHGPFKTPQEAAQNANEECMIIEYGIEYEDNCFQNNNTQKPENNKTFKPKKEISQKALDVLLKMVIKDMQVEQLTNKTIADWLIQNIWAEYDIDSDASAILGEAIERLKKI